MRLPKNFDKGITYYLAGPMSGYPDFNFPAFEAAQDELVQHGVRVDSPHTLDGQDSGLRGEELWKTMMRQALQMLLECDGIILLKGWTESRGALIEYNIAAGLKLPVYFLDGKYVIAMHNDSEDGDLVS